jgi:hypothetical protein
MKALLALLVETKPLEINKATAESIIRGTIASGDALMSTMLDIFPQPDWMRQISAPAHDRHFRQIYEHFHDWSGRLPVR